MSRKRPPRSVPGAKPSGSAVPSLDSHAALVATLRGLLAELPEPSASPASRVASSAASLRSELPQLGQNRLSRSSSTAQPGQRLTPAPYFWNTDSTGTILTFAASMPSGKLAMCASSSTTAGGFSDA